MPSIINELQRNDTRLVMCAFQRYKKNYVYNIGDDLEDIHSISLFIMRCIVVLIEYI